MGHSLGRTCRCMMGHSLGRTTAWCRCMMGHSLGRTWGNIGGRNIGGRNIEAWYRVWRSSRASAWMTGTCTPVCDHTFITQRQHSQYFTISIRKNTPVIWNYPMIIGMWLKGRIAGQNDAVREAKGFAQYLYLLHSIILNIKYYYFISHNLLPAVWTAFAILYCTDRSLRFCME